MVLLFVLMIALLLADALSDWAIALYRRLSMPRVRLVRARRYRFS